jgi:hypothetical protein
MYFMNGWSSASEGSSFTMGGSIGLYIGPPVFVRSPTYIEQYFPFLDTVVDPGHLIDEITFTAYELAPYVVWSPTILLLQAGMGTFVGLSSTVRILSHDSKLPTSLSSAIALYLSSVLSYSANLVWSSSVASSSRSGGM